jgi:hypothetical protein
MIYSNILLGELLRQLYTTWPSVPWYGGYLILVHFFSQTALLYCAISRGYSRIRLLIYFVYFALVGLAFLNIMQFTTTAFLAAQAGAFLLILAWNRRQSDARAPITGSLCAAVALLVIGSLVRMEAFCMALTLSASVALLLLRPATRAALAPVGSALAVGCALVGLAFLYNYAVYHGDPQWRDFLRRDALRRKFNDYEWTRYTPESVPAFAAAGWSENDHAMISNWYYDDPDVFTEAKLRAVSENHPWRIARLRRAFSLAVWKPILTERSLLAVLLALPFALFAVEPCGRARRAMLASLALGVLLLVLVTLNNKVPPMRVYLPIMSFPFSLVLLFARPRWTTKRAEESRVCQEESPAPVVVAPRWWRAHPRSRLDVFMIMALLVIAIFMGMYRQVRHSVNTTRMYQEVLTWIDLAQPNRDKLHVFWGPPLPLEATSPLDSLDAWAELPFLSHTWTTWAPFNEKLKSDHGFTSIAEALPRRNDILMAAHPYHMDLFQRFVAEHYGVALDFVASQPELPHRKTGWLKARGGLASLPVEKAQ